VKHVTTVRLPECWKRLVETVFPEGLSGILGEKTDHLGVADPKPHYDDCREVSGRFLSIGAGFRLTLHSGQHNYYGSLLIEDVNLAVIYEDLLESLGNAIEVKAGDGETYVIGIEWIPDKDWKEAR